MVHTSWTRERANFNQQGLGYNDSVRTRGSARRLRELRGDQEFLHELERAPRRLRAASGRDREPRLQRRLVVTGEQWSLIDDEHVDQDMRLLRLWFDIAVPTTPFIVRLGRAKRR